MIGKKIKELRERNCLSRKQLGDMLGLSEVMIQYIEKEQRACFSGWFSKLPNILKCSYAELFGEKSIRDNGVIIFKHFDNIKFLSEGKDFINNKDCEFIELSENFVYKTLGYMENYQNIYTFKIVAENMYPTINNNDCLFLDIDKKELFNGKMYMLLENGLLNIKRLQQINPNKRLVTVISDNPNKVLYPSYDVDLSVGEKLDIVGQIILHCNICR